MDINSLEYQPPRNGSLVLMLSLFLIMLVFFVLLNALSRPVEDKRAAALFGVQEGFDYRMKSDGREGDVLATHPGPEWLVEVEGKVRGVIQGFPGVKVTSSAEAGVVEVELALQDIWQKEAWGDGVVALVQNLKTVLTAISEVGMRVQIESGNVADVQPMLIAFAEQLPEVSVGWEEVTMPVAKVKLVVSGAVGLPEILQNSANAKIRKLLMPSGSMTNGQ